MSSNIKFRAKQGIEFTSKNGELADIVADALNDYGEDIKIAMNKIGYNLAKEGTEKVRRSGDFDDHTGDYRSNWDFTNKSTTTYVNYIIHNRRPTYRLTHLLEKGHFIRDTGKKTFKHEHIAPVNTEVVREFERRVKKMIEKNEV